MITVPAYQTAEVGPLAPERARCRSGLSAVCFGHVVETSPPPCQKRALGGFGTTPSAQGEAQGAQSGKPLFFLDAGRIIVLAS